MALDSYLVNAIENDVSLSSKAYYAGGAPAPTNPYQEGTEQYRIWQRARTAAANEECVAQYKKNLNSE